MIAPVVRKVRIEEQGTDFAFWQSQPVERRLEALEEIRREFHLNDHDSQQGLQRVFTVVKR